jgi:hypothetical protein
MGKNAPFLKHTNLSEKRYSRQFTLAQICINSFSKKQEGQFVRARYDDLADFFADNYSLGKNDENFVRIRKTLQLLNKGFGADAQNISSRAIAVTAYLFAEHLFLTKKSSQVKRFAGFYVKLLHEIRDDLERLTKYQQPKNRLVLENFQKHVTQASVEPSAIRRRHEFVEKAFNYYLKKTAIIC